jgi:hypothetical protein
MWTQPLYLVLEQFPDAAQFIRSSAAHQITMFDVMLGSIVGMVVFLQIPWS